jgi:hypothetical protein
MQIERVVQQKLDDTENQIGRLESNLSEKPKADLGRGAALMSRWEFN